VPRKVFESQRKDVICNTNTEIQNFSTSINCLSGKGTQCGKNQAQKITYSIQNQNRIQVFSGVMNLCTVVQHSEVRASVNVKIREILRKGENVTLYDW
jgi:hypothetical protein